MLEVVSARVCSCLATVKEGMWFLCLMVAEHQWKRQMLKRTILQNTSGSPALPSQPSLGGWGGSGGSQDMRPCCPFTSLCAVPQTGTCSPPSPANGESLGISRPWKQQKLSRIRAEIQKKVSLRGGWEQGPLCGATASPPLWVPAPPRTLTQRFLLSVLSREQRQRHSGGQFLS